VGDEEGAAFSAPRRSISGTPGISEVGLLLLLLMILAIVMIPYLFLYLSFRKRVRRRGRYAQMSRGFLHRIADIGRARHNQARSDY
jgi:hypothetical protein